MSWFLRLTGFGIAVTALAVNDFSVLWVVVALSAVSLIAAIY